MSDAYMTYTSMSQGAADIETVRTNLLTLLASVQSDVTSLGPAFSTETASAAFQAQVADFTTNMTKAFDGLDGLAKILTSGVTTFTDLDTSLSGSARSI